MIVSHHITRPVASQRQRDLLADAQHERLVCQLRAPASAARRRERFGRRLRRALRAATRLHPATQP